MKHLTTAAMALALAAMAAPAVAQPQQQPKQQPKHEQPHHGGQRPPGQPPPEQRPQGQRPQGQRPPEQRSSGQFRPPGRYAPPGQRPSAQRPPSQYRPSGQRPGARPAFNGPPRDRDKGRTQYSVARYPHTFNAVRRFRLAPPRYPNGWSYRRWSYGQFLPMGWFAPSYYLAWSSYGLPPPPIGCEWIRQGADALLVDIRTGEVLSVYRGVFYW